MLCALVHKTDSWPWWPSQTIKHTLSLRSLIQTTSKTSYIIWSIQYTWTNSQEVKWRTLIIKFGAFCKQILAASINTITMKIMWLKKFCPELWFSQLMWHILQVFLFYCWICFENTLYNVSCKIVLQSITAICLGFDVSLKPQLKSV
jgi:hypothetical protein